MKGFTFTTISAAKKLISILDLMLNFDKVSGPWNIG